jgi:hypothetical protein
MGDDRKPPAQPLGAFCIDDQWILSSAFTPQYFRCSRLKHAPSQEFETQTLTTYMRGDTKRVR